MRSPLGNILQGLRGALEIYSTLLRRVASQLLRPRFITRVVSAALATASVAAAYAMLSALSDRYWPGHMFLAHLKKELSLSLKSTPQGLIPIVIASVSLSALALSYLTRVVDSSARDADLLKARVERQVARMAEEAIERNKLKRRPILSEEQPTLERFRNTLLHDEAFLSTILGRLLAEGSANEAKQHVVQEVLHSIERRYKRKFSIQYGEKQTNILFRETEERLFTEIARLTRRGNLNLTIGLGTTALALGLLIFLTLNVGPTTDLKTAMVHPLPRLSTAAFAEVFAFFFLRLYKTSLDEIKYYQNQMTMLTQRQIALTASRTLGVSDTVGAILLSLTERDKENTPLTASGDDVKMKDVLELIQQALKLAGKA